MTKSPYDAANFDEVERRYTNTYCAEDLNNYSIDCSPALLAEKLNYLYINSVEICGIIELENICTSNFREQLKALDGSFNYQYTVGDSTPLQIAIPTTFSD